MAWWDKRARGNQRATNDETDTNDNVEMPPNADNANGGFSLTADAQALLNACGTANITTASAFTAQQARLTHLEAFHTTVVEAKRKDATAAAVRAFADKPERLEKAKKNIAACNDPEDLDGMIAAYIEQTPVALINGKPRQSADELPTTSEQTVEDKKTFYEKERAAARKQAGVKEAK